MINKYSDMEITVIKSYVATGLCGTCYRDLPATVEYRSDGAAYIVKNCPVHGREEAMMERDWRFLEEKLYSVRISDRLMKRYGETLIEVTDRCNVACKHCYHSPDNAIEDRPAEWIVEMARSVHTPSVCLMGAEPTMRRDLPEIVRQIKQIPWGDHTKGVSIYTNGIKLQNHGYVKQLAQSGVDTVNISVHNPDYHSHKVWKAISKSFVNIKDFNIRLGQVSFTVEKKEHLSQAVDRLIWLRDNGYQFHDIAVRGPAQIGVVFDQEQEIFVSDLYRWLEEILEEKQLSLEYDPDNSTSYSAGVLVDGSRMMLIHWPSAASINTTKAISPPFAKFIPNTYGSFVLQAILRDGWKKGWWQGQRLVDESSNVIWAKS